MLLFATYLTRRYKCRSEHNAAVNDSGYIIGSAITAIKFAIELAEFNASFDLSTRSTSPQISSDRASRSIEVWRDTITRLSPSLPYDASKQFHPEFEGMPYSGFTAKQADTLMLQYPLMLNHSSFTAASRRNDLAYHSANLEQVLLVFFNIIGL